MHEKERTSQLASAASYEVNEMKLTLQRMTLNINIISIPYKNTSNEVHHTEHNIGRGNDNNRYNYSEIT